ncbi:MAG: class I SAM-dependent methyltransferase [Gammaproteobacteria bacterium]|nr:class I SAM-dependent methyltransferase [Gammaproteobacteria bacterium]
MDRGQMGGLSRLPSLDAEQRLGFALSLRTMITAGGVSAKSRAAGAEAIKEAGVQAHDVEAICQVMDRLPDTQIRNRMLRSLQQMTWDSAFGAIAEDRERMERELRAETDDSLLQLDPSLEMPDYIRFDFHLQPGGYVGDALAGEVYHHGTNAFYMGLNAADRVHNGLVAGGQEPSSGGVARALDLATGIGQCATALKQRYPDAEVWGLDPAEPLLRYAHKRAQGMGRPVRFKQARGEDTGFRDGYFDLINSYILFHEIPFSATEKVVHEMHRILRPGGVFNIYDFPVGDPLSPESRYMFELDHRDNGEPWSIELMESDFDGLLNDAGFEVTPGPRQFLVVKTWHCRKPE